MLFEWGANGIKHAYNLEELAKCCLPGITVVIETNAIDQRQARAAGPAQNGHLGFMLCAVRYGAVYHIDNAGTLNQRSQQLTLVRKTPVILVLSYEGDRKSTRLNSSHVRI